MITTPQLNDWHMSGKFGNQLFLVAAALSAAKDYSTETIFPNWSIYPDDTNITEFFENPVNINPTAIVINNIYQEPHFHYKQIPNINNVGLQGYFQSCKYFEHNNELINYYFSAKLSVTDYINNKYGIYFNNSVSIHVRHGDYLTLPNHHPVIDISYYTNSINHIESSGVKLDNIIILSDDIIWCKENFKDTRCTFIENEKMYIDFFIMTKTNHNIIANSSFSWWGAWLNNNTSKIVIAPQRWFGPAYTHFNMSDLIPPTWIKI